LAGLGIEAMRGARVKFARLLDHRVTQERGQRNDLPAVSAYDVVALDAQLARRMQLRLRQPSVTLAHRCGGGLDRASRDVGLPASGRGACRPDTRVRLEDYAFFDP